MYSSDEVNNEAEKCLNPYKKSNETYIIESEEQYDSKIHEEVRNVTVFHLQYSSIKKWNKMLYKF